jgi:transposase InsO family protein
MRAEEAFPVAAMARVFEVTRQGYYAFVKRELSERVQAEAKLCTQVKEIFVEYKGCYGSPRIHRELQNRGTRVCKRRVERALRGMGLQACGPRRRFRPPLRDVTLPPAPNVLDRNFQAECPNQRWVTDITYIWTQAGWVYLAVILDLYSRAVVGWAIDTNLGTQLPLRALAAAIERCRPGEGLLHHSDRGSQYTSNEYRATLASLGITVSMSRSGNCWDNAVAESFFATIKRELIYRRSWTDVDEVRRAVFEYVDIFYNQRRMHSALGYQTPAAVEESFAAAA